MPGTIKSVFEGLTHGIAIDASFIQRIRDYHQAFVCRNEDHIKFFGGNLLGVNPIRFLPTDRERWFDDVLQIDDLQLQEELYALPSIHIERKVASDIFNHSCVWACHAILNSPHLTPVQKERGMLDTMLVLQCKYLTSIMYRQFRYPADESVSLATYDALTLKFSLKAAGSWNALLLKRAHDIIDKNSIHYSTLKSMSPDGSAGGEGVIYVINDVQGRLREIVKSMMQVFYRIKEQGTRVTTNKATIELDGIIQVRDVHRDGTTYIRYLHEVIDDKQTFVKEELTKIVCDAMHTMTPRLFIQTLEWMSVNHHTKVGKDIDKLIDETIIYAYNLVSTQRSFQGTHQGFVNLLVKLRSLYMASRMADPTLILCRDLAEKIVKDGANTNNSTVIASLRTGVQMYLVLRALTMKYYT